MKKIIAAFLVFSSIGLSVIALGVGGSATIRPNANADAFNQGPDVDRSSAIVQLKGDPISVHSATKPAAGKKIDFNSNTVRSVRAQLAAGRNEFKRWLRANAPRARVTSEYDVSLNAVAVQLNGTPLATIAAAPMVQSADYNALYHPNLSQSYHFIVNADPALDRCWWQSRCRRRHQDRRHRYGYRQHASVLRSDWFQLSSWLSEVRCGRQQFASPGPRLQVRLPESYCRQGLL